MKTSGAKLLLSENFRGKNDTKKTSRRWMVPSQYFCSKIGIYAEEWFESLKQLLSWKYHLFFYEKNIPHKKLLLKIVLRSVMKVKEITKRGGELGISKFFSVHPHNRKYEGNVEIKKKSLTQEIYTGSVQLLTYVQFPVPLGFSTITQLQLHTL